MKDARFVFTLVAVAVSVNIAWSNAQEISPRYVLPATSCASTSCNKGQICRIVVRADGICATQCLDPKHVPRSGRSQLCGTSGHPVLVERKTYLRASRPYYSTFRVDEERPCPSKDLVKRYSVCCAETQKEGVCPAPASVEIRRTSCRGDNQCRGNEKCCQNARGGNTCANPITSKTVCDPQNCIPGIPCAILDCVPGTICVELPTGATCKQGPPTDCTVIECPPDFRCIDFPTGSKCVPLSTCAGILCQVGESCVNTPSGSECQPMTDICQLPKEPGRCLAVIPRFFFNSATQQCESFVYGGCGGNANRFSTLRECNAACSAVTDICQLPKEVGPCKAFVPSFFFNSATQQCESFVYGGCRGNKNRFSTLAECVAACPSMNKPGECPPPFTIPGASSGRCGRPCVNDSSCEGTQKCCTADSCGLDVCSDPLPASTCASRFCGPGTTCVETPKGAECRPDVCSLPPVVGPCEAIIPSYYYDPKSNSCKPFNYGGCQGNANRFRSRRSCERACEPLHYVIG